MNESLWYVSATKDRNSVLDRGILAGDIVCDTSREAAHTACIRTTNSDEPTDIWQVLRYEGVRHTEYAGYLEMIVDVELQHIALSTTVDKESVELVFDINVDTYDGTRTPQPLAEPLMNELF